MKKNLLTHLMRLIILFLLFFGLGTGTAEAGAGLECRGTTPTKPTALAADLADPAVGPALLDFLSGNAAGITAANRLDRLKAWEGLRNTGIGTDIPWLTRASKWIDEGAEFAADGSGKLTKNGEDILQIKNDKILPDKFDFDPSTQKPNPGGTAIGEPSNGYQVYKHGDDLSVRRVPSEAGISPSNISTLNGGGKGHCLHRHGADVTDDALKKRATEGRAPDGSARTRNNDTETYIPPKSSKFNSPDKVNEALTEVGPGSSKYNAAKSAAESSGVNSFPVNHDFGAGSNMGKAYQIPGSQGWHPTSSLPLSGTPQELSGLTKVKAIFVRDGPGDPWYLLTMYPD